MYRSFSFLGLSVCLVPVWRVFFLPLLLSCLSYSARPRGDARRYNANGQDTNTQLWCADDLAVLQKDWRQKRYRQKMARWPTGPAAAAAVARTRGACGLVESRVTSLEQGGSQQRAAMVMLAPWSTVAVLLLALTVVSDGGTGTARQVRSRQKSVIVSGRWNERGRELKAEIPLCIYRPTGEYSDASSC